MPTHSTIASWLTENGGLLAVLGVLSVLLLAATVFATPWLLARLPRDYFHAARAPLHLGPGPGGTRRLLLLVARNLAGALFALLGLIMMVTPGPGIVALLLGLSLCEFPGKRRLLRRLAAHPDVFSSLNWIRRRTGSEPFEHPYAASGEIGEPDR